MQILPELCFKGEPPIQGSDIANGQNEQLVHKHTRLLPNKQNGGQHGKETGKWNLRGLKPKNPTGLFLYIHKKNQDPGDDRHASRKTDSLV
jgi:hypothetical protein